MNVSADELLGEVEVLEDTNHNLRAEIQRLLAATQPLIKAAENYSDCLDEKYIDHDATVSVGDLRALRAACGADT